MTTPQGTDAVQHQVEHLRHTIASVFGLGEEDMHDLPNLCNVVQRVGPLITAARAFVTAHTKHEQLQAELADGGYNELGYRILAAQEAMAAAAASLAQAVQDLPTPEAVRVLTLHDLSMIVLHLLHLRGAGRWSQEQPMIVLSAAQQEAIRDSSANLHLPSIRVLTASAAFEISVEPGSPFATDVSLVLLHDLLQLSHSHRTPRPLTDEQQRLLRDASVQSVTASGDGHTIHVGLGHRGQLTMTIRATAEYIEDTFILPGIIDEPVDGFTNGITVNGWAMPFFTHETADNLCQRLNATYREIYNQYGVVAGYEADANCFSIPDMSNPNIMYHFYGVSINTPSGVVLGYPLGEEGLLWTRATSQPADTDDESFSRIPPAQRVVALVEAHGDVFQWRRRDGQRGGPFPSEQQAADDAYAHGATHAVSEHRLEVFGARQERLAATLGAPLVGFNVADMFIHAPCAAPQFRWPCNPLDAYGADFERSEFVLVGLIPPSEPLAAP